MDELTPEEFDKIFNKEWGEGVQDYSVPSKRPTHRWCGPCEVEMFRFSAQEGDYFFWAWSCDECHVITVERKTN